MKQCNVTYLRKFIERERTAVNNGKQVIEHEEIRRVCAELTDLLLYKQELENKLADLHKEKANDQMIVLDIKSQDF